MRRFTSGRIIAGFSQIILHLQLIDQLVETVHVQSGRGAKIVWSDNDFACFFFVAKISGQPLSEDAVNYVFERGAQFARTPLENSSNIVV